MNMKNFYTIAPILIALSVGIYFSLTVDEKKVTNNNTYPNYSNEVLGIEFAYRAGPDGYVIQEYASSRPTEDLLSTIVLMRTEDAERPMPVGGEGPATITIQVLKNLKKQQSEAWANTNNIYSNINLKTGEVSEYVLGGANAIRYSATGLYESDNVVVAHGENVYVLSGNYMDAESDLRKDFTPLLESVRFIPQPGQN